MASRSPRRSKRIRRSLAEVTATALKLADAKPFTAQEYAGVVGVTPNRGRQLLEQLRDSGKLGELGHRKSARGKPSVLWGTPGTKLTDSDIAARPSRRGPKTGGAASARADAKAGPDFFERFILSVFGRGFEVRGADGRTWRFEAHRVK